MRSEDRPLAFAHLLDTLQLIQGPTNHAIEVFLIPQEKIHFVRGSRGALLRRRSRRLIQGDASKECQLTVARPKRPLQLHAGARYVC
jgi:hypothetical protein